MSLAGGVAAGVGEGVGVCAETQKQAEIINTRTDAILNPTNFVMLMLRRITRGEVLFKLRPMARLARPPLPV